MLYTFTHYATLYELYVGLLRALIAVAVALSMLISVDRIYKVRLLSFTFRNAMLGGHSWQRVPETHLCLCRSSSTSRCTQGLS